MWSRRNEKQDTEYPGSVPRGASSSSKLNVPADGWNVRGAGIEGYRQGERALRGAGKCFIPPLSFLFPFAHHDLLLTGADIHR